MDTDWSTKLSSNDDYYLRDSKNLNISFGNDDMNFDMGMLLNDSNNNNSNNNDFDGYMLENFLNEESLNKIDDAVNMEDIKSLDILDVPKMEPTKKPKTEWNLDMDNKNKAATEGKSAFFNDKASIELLSSPLGEALWKQQEELRKALRIQQELNAQVVKKLDQTVEQQVQLQKALQQQNHLAPPSRPTQQQQDYSLSPALSHGNNNNDYIDLLMDGQEEHDDLQIGKSFMMSSNTAFNGSPMKRENKLGKRNTYLKPNMKLNFQDGGKNKAAAPPPYTPKSRVSSMTFTPKTLATPDNHEETLQNVTISPQSVTMSPVIGLGLHVAPSEGGSKIDIMPTIPGSASATPAGKQKPKKHYQFDMEYPLYDNDEEDEQFEERQNSQLHLVDSSLLLPPDSSSPERRGTSSSSPQELSMSPGPSPVLKARDMKSRPGSPVRVDFSKNTYLDAAQDEDEDEDIPASPTKITRKLTTLPRGSIDVYVKELPDRQYECMFPACGKLFKRRYNIRSHIQTHLEDRPYACDYDGCDKAFVRNHDLVRHKKTHQEKSYACPCGKKFNREDALAVHRSRMICIGGKKYSNVVIKRSPRKRGRPRKEDSASPTKELVSRMEETLTRQANYVSQ